MTDQRPSSAPAPGPDKTGQMKPGQGASRVGLLRQLGIEWGYLLARPILYSGLLALVVSLLVLIADYRSEQQRQAAEMDKIETHTAVIGRQISAFDYPAAQDSLALLLSDPLVLSVDFVHRSGDTITVSDDVSPETLSNSRVVE